MNARCLALSASILVLALAGCASKPVAPEQVIRQQAEAMRTALTRLIAEPTRRAELLAQVDALETVLKEQNQDLISLARELHTLNSDYDTTRGRFEDSLAHFRERVDERFTRVQAAHFEMVRRMDEKEWKQMVELEHKALDAAGSANVPAMRGGKS